MSSSSGHPPVKGHIVFGPRGGGAGRADLYLIMRSSGCSERLLLLLSPRERRQSRANPHRQLRANFYFLMKFDKSLCY